MDPFCFFSLLRLGPCIRQHLYKTFLKSSPVIGTSCVRSGVRGGLTEILQAPCLRPCERWNVPAADAVACTAAATAGVAGVAAVIDTADFSRLGGGRWCRGVALILALLKGADGTGGLPSATPPVLAPGSAAGALRVAGRIGPTPVMSRSNSLAKSATLPPS